MDKNLSYKEQKKYYDTNWANLLDRKRCEDEICRKEFIIFNIKKMQSKSKHRLKIIDLGCGPGGITDAVSDYGDVVGVDLSINVAKKCIPT